MKHLKIRFDVYTGLLVMTVLEQKGLPQFKNDGNVYIKSEPYIQGIPTGYRVHLRGKHAERDKNSSAIQTFKGREIVTGFIQDITNELFSTMKPETGDYVLVKDKDGQTFHTLIYVGKLEEPTPLGREFVVVSDGGVVTVWQEMKPLNSCDFTQSVTQTEGCETIIVEWKEE